MNFINAPILAYHEISPGAPPANYPWAVSASQLKREMQYLHDHGYTCLPLTELLPVSNNRRSRPQKGFALTFDDGFQDFYTLAAPILCEFGFTATIFVITGKTHSQGNGKDDVDNPYLTWEQIKALQDGGFSFGSHTCTHSRLPDLTREQIYFELVASKESLESRLGRPVSTGEIQEMARMAGYRAAFGGYPGGGGFFSVRRHLCLANDTLADLALGSNRYFRYLEYVWYDSQLAQFLRRVKQRIGL
jgi:peptidoglycan/xylan/chitin deacetylase (PgdA/CDA1 family)